MNRCTGCLGSPRPVPWHRCYVSIQYLDHSADKDATLNRVQPSRQPATVSAFPQPFFTHPGYEISISLRTKKSRPFQVSCSPAPSDLFFPEAPLGPSK